MRFPKFAILFNIALFGLATGNLTANATPQYFSNVAQTSTHDLTLLQRESDTVIKGNGVEFVVPAGFKGGSPSDDQVRQITTEAVKIAPSMAPFVKILDSNPSILRALAISTGSNPEVIMISRLPLPGKVSIVELEAMMAKAFPALLPPEFKLTEHKVDTVGSRQVARLLVTADIQGIKLQELVGLFVEGNEVFQVTYAYSEADSKQANRTFKQVVNSFKATADTATEKS
jgi:hypothetical protein